MAWHKESGKDRGENNRGDSSGQRRSYCTQKPVFLREGKFIQARNKFRPNLKKKFSESEINISLGWLNRKEQDNLKVLIKIDCSSEPN